MLVVWHHVWHRFPGRCGCPPRTKEATPEKAGFSVRYMSIGRNTQGVIGSRHLEYPVSLVLYHSGKLCVPYSSALLYLYYFVSYLSFQVFTLNNWCFFQSRRSSLKASVIRDAFSSCEALWFSISQPMYLGFDMSFRSLPSPSTSSFWLRA